MSSSQVSRRISQLEERLQKLLKEMPTPEIREMTDEEAETVIDLRKKRSGHRQAKVDPKILSILKAARTRLLKRLGK